jgi:hypothetical protein
MIPADRFELASQVLMARWSSSEISGGNACEGRF